ncbi:ATP-binding protein [Streptomyces sp. S07_1.15]|uniref:ATP-binding protein n=1 Tax=Streptomyces sp. S07_1.15 TaxID=2873925 RepID=UPI001D152120|nr:ATP-binding protein [Streptomyces sp. S07_1.15]MCC3655350.1 ATP-binding protein [Streptomyces sp. S07_1.15]
MNSETGQNAALVGIPSVAQDLTLRFSSTPRGARLARRLAGQWLDERGVPYGSETHDAVTLVVAELASNAARHGCVPGRDFRLGMAIGRGGVRVEVTDTRAERLPVPARPGERDADAESGRGLLLVAALADRWGWEPRSDGPGKTVWAECRLPGRRRAG